MWIIFVPILIFYNVIKGFLGRTAYKSEIKSSLSLKAKKLYNSLPKKVAAGLSEPVGDNAEIAWKYLVDHFDHQGDQKWARRLIARSKDVLAVITSLIIVLIINVAIFGFDPLYSLIRPLPNIDPNMKEIESMIENLNDQELKSS